MPADMPSAEAAVTSSAASSHNRASTSDRGRRNLWHTDATTSPAPAPQWPKVLHNLLYAHGLDHVPPLMASQWPLGMSATTTTTFYGVSNLQARCNLSGVTALPSRVYSHGDSGIMRTYGARCEESHTYDSKRCRQHTIRQIDRWYLARGDVDEEGKPAWQPASPNYKKTTEEEHGNADLGVCLYEVSGLLQPGHPARIKRAARATGQPARKKRAPAANGRPALRKRAAAASGTHAASGSAPAAPCQPRSRAPNTTAPPASLPLTTPPNACGEQHATAATPTAEGGLLPALHALSDLAGATASADELMAADGVGSPFRGPSPSPSDVVAVENAIQDLEMADAWFAAEVSSLDLQLGRRAGAAPIPAMAPPAQDSCKTTVAGPVSSVRPDGATLVWPNHTSVVTNPDGGTVAHPKRAAPSPHECQPEASRMHLSKAPTCTDVMADLVEGVRCLDVNRVCACIDECKLAIKPDEAPRHFRLEDGRNVLHLMVSALVEADGMAESCLAPSSHPVVRMVSHVLDCFGERVFDKLMCQAEYAHKDTPLTWACRWGDPKVVGYLMPRASRQALLCQTLHCYLALHCAARCGHVFAVKAYIQRLLQVSSRDVVEAALYNLENKYFVEHGVPVLQQTCLELEQELKLELLFVTNRPWVENNARFMRVALCEG